MKGMTRDIILQDTRRNIRVISNDTDIHIDDDEGAAHGTIETMSPRVGVCVPREMTLSRVELYDPSMDSTIPDSRTGTTLIWKDPNTVNILDSGNEACVTSEGISCIYVWLYQGSEQP